MSHFVTIASRITEMEALKKALGRMKVSYTDGEFTIKRSGKSAAAQLKIDNAVGFGKQADGTYALVGDPYYSTQLRKYYGKAKQLQADLHTAYSIEETIMRMEEQQFHCVENQEATVGQDNLIHMTFARA